MFVVFVVVRFGVHLCVRLQSTSFSYILHVMYLRGRHWIWMCVSLLNEAQTSDIKAQGKVKEVRVISASQTLAGGYNSTLLTH